MVDTDKLTIKAFDPSKSDYTLRKIRVEAACDAKGLSESLKFEVCPENRRVEEFGKMKQQASKIIISAPPTNPFAWSAQ